MFNKEIKLEHQSQWQQLMQRRSKGQMPHSLLLSGPRGGAKLEFAQALAASMLCEQDQDIACGRCNGCHLMQAQSHPDFILLQPESTILKINEIREITQIIYSTSQFGGYQVVIIEPAEAMNTAAANAFLKTLEEPPGKVLLILVTHQPSRLLATIKSRCQIVRFASDVVVTLDSEVEEKIQDLWLQTHCAVRERLNCGDKQAAQHLIKAHEKTIALQRQYQINNNLNPQLFLEDLHAS